MGIVRSLIGGGCNAILSAPVSMGIDSEHFNFQGGLHHMMQMMVGMFVGGAILHMVLFLSTHNAQDAVTTEVKQTTTLTQTTQTTESPSSKGIKP
jgi:hypothetical protein